MVETKQIQAEERREAEENKNRQGTEVTEKGLLRRLRQGRNVRAVVKGSRKPTTDTTANLYLE